MLHIGPGVGCTGAGESGVEGRWHLGEILGK